MDVNGKFYPMWGQFVEKQEQWIGGTLEDFGDSMDNILGFKPMKTDITGVELNPNGDDSAFFIVKGDDFDCGFDVAHGGIVGGDDGWITFSGYGGHMWRIKTKNENK